MRFTRLMTESRPPRPVIEFRALGPAQLTGPDGTDPDAVLARPKLLGLLAYLSAGPAPGFLRRDSVIGCFWPDLTQERARSAMRQSLYRLRQFLGDSVVVTRGDDEVGLSEQTFWSDVAAFEAALAAGDRASALQLYRGDLLDGLYLSHVPEFERWLDTRRKDLRQRASTAAWELADAEAGLHHTAAAGQWGRRARSMAPLDERMLQRVVMLLDRLGDRAGAVREYETFARRLADELELEPSPETKALIETVRDRGQPIPRERPAPAVASGFAAGGHRPDERTVASLPSPGSDFARRYRLEQVIGAGGMATVYRARDLRHDRDVAVKLMHTDLSAPLGAEWFFREIRIAASLTHPHIVPVFDSGSEEGRLYYVMPLIPGESLRERLTREGQLSLEEALGYTRDVASALEYAHGQGVVHRDVKPENILLTGDRALVTDFGIARALAGGAATRLTGVGVSVGTPGYMSPEQAAGDQEVEYPADLYSLGCVLFEMLAGRPPFTGANAEAITDQHRTVAPPSITDYRPNVPPDLVHVIERALAKSPADRFADASEFVRALRTIGLSGRRTAWRRFRWLAVPAVAVLVALALRWSQSPALDRFRVVVAPFENRTGDTTLTLVGNLAADWITRGLQQIDVIEVVPTSTSITPGAGSPSGASARTVGLATRAGTVVTGSFYRRGDALEFQTQVIDAIDDRLLRAVAPVVAPRSASGMGLDSLRRAVVTAVAAALDYRLLGPSPTSTPPSLEAYRAYIEGHRAFYHAGPTRMREVLTHMYQAVALDSMFPDPRFFLVMAHRNLSELRAADSNASLLLPFRSRFSPFQRASLDWMVANLRGDRAGALRAARARGIAEDIAVEALWSNQPYETIEILEGHDELPEPRFFFKWSALMDAFHLVGQHERERREARRARGVFPDRLMMLGHELQALAALGRIHDVEHGLNESLLMPQEPESRITQGDLMFAVADELRTHGYPEASQVVAKRGLEWFTARPADDVAGRTRYATVLYAAENWDTARESFRDLLALVPNDMTVLGYLGVLAARQGDRDEALECDARIAALGDPYQYGEPFVRRARIAAQLGERDRAVALLREAFSKGMIFSVSLHRDADLQALRGYPPFEELLAPRR